MSTNYHTPWVDSATHFKASEMNVPLGELDQAVSDTNQAVTGLQEALGGLGDVFVSGPATHHVGYVAVWGPGDSEPGQESTAQELVDGFPVTAAGAALLDDTDAEAQRSTLGLGDAATKNVGTENGTVAAGDHTHNQPYDVVGYFSGKPSNSQLLFVMRFARAVTFPASFTGSKADLQVAATAETVFTLKKNGDAFGYITFEASGTVGAFASDTETTFDAGDILAIYSPSTADATAASLSWTLVGERD